MFSCATCGFALHNPIAQLGAGSLGLYDDARFPGRCILMYARHAEHLDALSESEASALMKDVQVAARAIKAAVGADRINFAVLGNAHPHLHVHLVPRKAGGDPVPKKSPWQHPDDARALPAEERSRLLAEIAEQLTKTRP